MSVKWNGASVMANARAGAMKGVVKGTMAVHEEATSLILETPKTGRTYRRGGVTHQASAPGEPFASDTGRTVKSGETKFDAPNLAGLVNWSTAYAGYLEHGTQKMAARPFARPALSNRKDEIAEGIADEVRRALK